MYYEQEVNLSNDELDIIYIALKEFSFYHHDLSPEKSDQVQVVTEIISNAIAEGRK
jgi:hypothetical protein